MIAKQLRMLVVDDENIIRWSLCERLERLGHAVDSAENGEAAVEKVAEGQFDFMLLDVRLPGMDGLAVLKKALSACPDLAVVMMSAYGTVDLAVKAMKLGALDFMLKPFTFDDLDTVLSQVMTIQERRRQRREMQASPSQPDSAIGSIVGKSPAMEELRNLVARVAASDAATVLVEGESGVGKEVAARAIHFESARANKPFMQLNCGALPEQLLESELFGHERGAFTDAHVQKVGLIESAAGGSVFLDELGELPMSGQVKLLQLLENKTFRRVGGTEELQANVRVIAATNQDLSKRVEEGRFRADVYFRLNVVSITVPGLRDHIDDVPLLAAHFIQHFNREMDCQMKGVSEEALEILLRYKWPGNVRELRNIIERTLILHPTAEELLPGHLPGRLRTGDLVQAEPTAPSGPSQPLTLSSMERRLISEALDRAHGNQSKAARELGISRDALRYRMKKHGML